MLTFDEAAHVYHWDGVRVPNVTSVLAPLVDYSHIAPATLEVARQKGVACHKMVEMDCRGEEMHLPAWMQPAYEQWLKFKVESGFVLLESEHKVYHPIYKYAGTLDLRGIINGEIAFIDVKRSFAAGPVIGLQLAAYENAYNAQQFVVGKPAKRYALKLSEVGPYRLEPFTDKSDFTTFLSLLTIANWKRKHLS